MSLHTLLFSFMNNSTRMMYPNQVINTSGRKLCWSWWSKEGLEHWKSGPKAPSGRWDWASSKIEPLSFSTRLLMVLSRVGGAVGKQKRLRGQMRGGTPWAYAHRPSTFNPSPAPAFGTTRHIRGAGVLDRKLWVTCQSVPLFWRYMLEVTDSWISRERDALNWSSLNDFPFNSWKEQGLRR